MDTQQISQTLTQLYQESGKRIVFWYDADRHQETREAMKKDRPFEPVTRLDETYRSP